MSMKNSPERLLSLPEFITMDSNASDVDKVVIRHVIRVHTILGTSTDRRVGTT